MDDPLRIGRHAAIPLSEIELRTSRSSGPGGQHANVTASRVEASFDVEASRAIDEDQKRRITARLGPVVRAVAQDTRSQTRNRDLALERLAGGSRPRFTSRAGGERVDRPRHRDATRGKTAPRGPQARTAAPRCRRRLNADPD